MIEIRRYVTRSGKDVFGSWLARLHDRKAQARILARIDRLALGSFGDCKRLRGGICELRIDWGPGYRVYYAMDGELCVLLLSGGDKRNRRADIQRAIEYLRDYQERTGKE